MSTDTNPPLHNLVIEGIGKIPKIEFQHLESGAIRFRYLIEGDKHPGFDGLWRAMSAADRQEHLRIGGSVAEWLRSLG